MSLLRCLMIFSTIGESPTIYTNVHSTLHSLVTKYLLRIQFIRTKYEHCLTLKLAQLDCENLPTAIASEGVLTPPVVSLRSLHPDRLSWNKQSKCLHTYSIMNME